MELCRELKENLTLCFVFFFLKKRLKMAISKTGENKRSSPLPLSPQPSPLANICPSQLLLNRTRAIRTRCDRGPGADVGFLRKAEVTSPGRSWSSHSSWSDCSGLNCWGGSSSGRLTPVPPSLFSLSPPHAFSKWGEEKAPGFPALLSFKMPSRSHRTQNPGSKEFCREGLADPERSSEIGAQGQF